MKLLKHFLVALIIIVPGYDSLLAQNTVSKAEPQASASSYTVPVGTSNNEIQLVLENSTGKSLKDISVIIDSKPSWMQLNNNEIEIANLQVNQEEIVSFLFSVNGEATIDDTAVVNIIASNNEAFIWAKTIRLSPGAPEKFELLSNYPNPFNPSTTISYRLPAQMNIVVSIYNILGHKVATLVEGPQNAGQHELLWDASNMASGLYFYRIVAKGENTKTIVDQKKMMLIK
ncbi:MAG: T9SS type A sorting domain-containing protein [Gracilimonas sp.]|uniref:T9SS type A sorting domain-containing protein n=1 Tax=Gracilimonas sp. TaxID=1974203 RepID=UPI0037526A8C|nr:T9SS type A sorting domain-containing protein [Gracilimonas sp.]